LRNELMKLGHEFKSRTDSEVVLRSFIQWGISCVNRFCGMFAFAMWDSTQNKIYLARDPLGMKPLYYTELFNGIAFASELKAFLAVPDFKVQVDRVALGQFLEFGYTFDSNATFLTNVYKLPPGHLLEITNGIPGTPVCFFKPTLCGQD